MSECTAQCWTEVECYTCRRHKAPRGRSVPMAAAGGYCDTDCSGYRESPAPGHMWPCEAPKPCADCGKPADDDCPGCGKSVCSVCAEREGSFCCDGEGGEVKP